MPSLYFLHLLSSKRLMVQKSISEDLQHQSNLARPALQRVRALWGKNTNRLKIAPRAFPERLGNSLKKHKKRCSFLVARSSLLDARKKSPKVGPKIPKIDPKSTKIDPKVSRGGHRAPSNVHWATHGGQRATGIGHRARRSSPRVGSASQGRCQVPRARVPYIKAHTYIYIYIYVYR